MTARGPTSAAVGEARVSSSRALAWREALAYLTRHKRAVVQSTSVTAVVVLLVNLPWTPGSPWLRGFVTALLIAALAWMVTWAMWVPSGLAPRIQGAIAEDWTADLLDRHPAVLGVVPSLKYGSGDVDHVVVTGSRILAVETKWSAHRPTAHDLRRAAEQADRVAHLLRLQLTRSTHKEPVGHAPVQAVVLFWGPQVDPTMREIVVAARGPVPVLGCEAAQLELADGHPTVIGPDFAEELTVRLTELARVRDRAALPVSGVVRWLARIR